MGRFLLFALNLPFVCAGWTAMPAKVTPFQKVDSWAATSGFPGGYVYSIAQTNDGYLWIGSSRGLIRYDGLTFSLIQQTDHYPASNAPVLGLVKDSADQLWAVDDLTHIYKYMGGRLEGPEPDNGQHRHRFAAVATNRHGWLLFASELQGVIEYEQGRRRVVLDPSAMPSWPTAIAQTSDGVYWIGTRDTGVFRVDTNGGVGRIGQVAGMQGTTINCMLPMDGSTLLVCTNKGLVSLHNGRMIQQTRMEIHGHEIVALARGREGEVWIDADGQLFRADTNEIAANGTIQSLDHVEVVKPVTALFEDREGNLWLGGPDSIERYRGDGFKSYLSTAGLLCSNCGAIFVDEQDSVWFAPWGGGLFRLSNGVVEQIKVAGLKDDAVYSISGSGDEIWVGRKHGGVTRLLCRGEVSAIRTYRRRDGLAQDSVYSIYLAPDGTVWAGTISGGVSRLRDNNWRTFTTQDGLPSNSISVIAGDAEGRVFVGTPNGIAELGESGWIAYTTRNGLPPGAVESLLPDHEGTLWIGTTKGISFLRSGMIHVPLGAPNPLYGEILGIAENRGWLWISTGNHVLRVKRAALLNGAFDAGDYREFGVPDGLPSVEGVKRSRSVVQDSRGRVWFSMRQGISVLQASAFTRPAFRVTIRVDGVVIDGKLIPAGSGIRVGPSPRRLTFRYAGVNVSDLKDVRYRYRLESVEAGWSEPTAAREVDYTNVPPGHYSFHVQARNADGIWNGNEATMTFDVEPAFWQNRTYQLFAAAAVMLFGLAFFRLRVHQIAARAHLRYAERLAERTRIARDLHDTLLQGFHGLMLRLQALDDLLPQGEAKEELEQTLDRADQVVAESRKAVHDLRLSTVVTNDLARTVRALGDELSAANSATFSFLMEGRSRELHPIVRDEFYRIAREALRNAFSHSRAHHIEAEITYGERLLRLRIRDDGDGIAPEILEGGRSGHYGLAGMRERAGVIGAKLDIWTGIGTGTEIDLSIAGSIAYGRRPSRSVLRVFREKAE